MQEQGGERETVEGLLEQLGTLAGAAPAAKSLELWVPKELVLEGRTVSFDEGMAIINDAALAHGYESTGFSESATGRLYRYVRAQPADSAEDSWRLTSPLAWIILAAIVAGFFIVTNF